MPEIREPVPGCLVWHCNCGCLGLIEAVKNGRVYIWWDFYQPAEEPMPYTYPNRLLEILEWPAGLGCLQDERSYLEEIT